MSWLLSLLPGVAVSSSCLLPPSHWMYLLTDFALSICLDCKTLAPIWETVAHDFALESDIVIAKVDAEAENARALAKEQGITGYPTIKFFPKGSTEPEAYSGARSEEGFIEFLNTKTGSNRAVGGGLNTQAGTVAVLDKLVAEYVPAKDFAKLATEIKNAAKDLQDKYAQYYVKVADKLSENQEYASKELARLVKVLSKGGSAPEKLDDLVSRSNILRAFAGDEPKDEL